MIVLNDSMQDIRDDEDFGRKVYNAISMLSLPPQYRKRPELNLSGGEHGVDIGAGGSSTAATVIETHNAQYDTLIAFGGNMGRVISSSIHPMVKDVDESMEVRYLRDLADQLGYTIRKKPNRK